MTEPLAEDDRCSFSETPVVTGRVAHADDCPALIADELHRIADEATD